LFTVLTYLLNLQDRNTDVSVKAGVAIVYGNTEMPSWECFFEVDISNYGPPVSVSDIYVEWAAKDEHGNRLSTPVSEFTDKVPFKLDRGESVRLRRKCSDSFAAIVRKDVVVKLANGVRRREPIAETKALPWEDAK